jgi:hypothetical protein
MQPISNHNPINHQSSNLPSIFGKSLGIKDQDSNILSVGGFFSEPKLEPYSEEIVNFINDYLPLSGTLIQDERGFVFLNVVNEYIYELMPFIDSTSLTLPPYFEGLFKHGAHVSVILPNELKDEFRSELLGKEINFSVTGCYSTSPENWLEIEKVWFLNLESPELNLLRKSMDLSSYLFDQQFHITIAVKKRFLNIYEILQSENQKISIRDIF